MEVRVASKVNEMVGRNGEVVGHNIQDMMRRAKSTCQKNEDAKNNSSNKLARIIQARCRASLSVPWISRKSLTSEDLGYFKAVWRRVAVIYNSVIGSRVRV